MRRAPITSRALYLLAGLCLPLERATAQGILEGRLLQPRTPGSESLAPLTGVVVWAALPGTESEPLSFRSWETEPTGWFRLSGVAGQYTVASVTPAHFARPSVLTNVFLRDGEKLKLSPVPRFDAAELREEAWDRQPARAYYQPFVAGGESVTHVGFKLATDGIDGPGPGSQDISLCVLRAAPGTEAGWQPVGPVATAVQVDCGGPKSYWYSAGWGSGEVPTRPGQSYLLEVRPREPGRTIQAFWAPSSAPETQCWRLPGGADGAGAAAVEKTTGKSIWHTIASDGDGLLVSYPKRVHRQFYGLTRFAKKWSQTYVARGRSLSVVVLYAAVSGAQPPLSRQRVRVRVRRGGPDGPQVGIDKIAVGNGNYTGDASWGMFGAVYAPGEVPLEPGTRYAIEFESLETPHTLHNFVNIKGEVSNDRPGFNPYRKHPPDDEPLGEAYYLGTERFDHDLDLEVLEYAGSAESWGRALRTESFLLNGGMEVDAVGLPLGWRPFGIAGHARVELSRDPGCPRNQLLRLVEGSRGERDVDLGVVQRVEGLDPAGNFVLTGTVRPSWPTGREHVVKVGLDPTGQDRDVRAPSIRWLTVGAVHGELQPVRTEPLRPEARAMSVWLRLEALKRPDDAFPFFADFDAFSLRQVDTRPPPLPGRGSTRSAGG